MTGKNVLDNISYSKKRGEQIKQARERIHKMYSQLGSWPRVEEVIGINRTTIHRIATDNNYFPQDLRILIILRVLPIREKQPPRNEQIQSIRDYFADLHDIQGFSWPEIQEITGINRATANRIVNDLSYFPKDERILKKLGISPMGEAPVCQACGIVHLATNCPDRQRPLENYKDLFSIPVDDLKWMIENRNEEF